MHHRNDQFSQYYIKCDLIQNLPEKEFKLKCLDYICGSLLEWQHRIVLLTALMSNTTNLGRRQMGLWPRDIQSCLSNTILTTLYTLCQVVAFELEYTMKVLSSKAIKVS